MDTYILYGTAFSMLVISALKDREKTWKALKKAVKSFEKILTQFITILMLVGIILSIMDTETISQLIGTESGWFGTILAALVGAITLIPGFIAFATAAALREAGAGTMQIAAFISSLMMVGVATLPMEIRYMGKKTAILRNGLAFVFTFLAAFLMEGVMRSW